MPEFRQLMQTVMDFCLNQDSSDSGIIGFLSESGFSGLKDFQDFSLMNSLRCSKRYFILKLLRTEIQPPPTPPFLRRGAFASCFNYTFCFNWVLELGSIPFLLKDLRNTTEMKTGYEQLPSLKKEGLGVVVHAFRQRSVSWKSRLQED